MTSSNPSVRPTALRTIVHFRIWNLSEKSGRQTHNLVVVGSSPTRPTFTDVRLTQLTS